MGVRCLIYQAVIGPYITTWEDNKPPSNPYCIKDAYLAYQCLHIRYMGYNLGLLKHIKVPLTNPFRSQLFGRLVGNYPFLDRALDQIYLDLTVIPCCNRGLCIILDQLCIFRVVSSLKRTSSPVRMIISFSYICMASARSSMMKLP
jgi:hypothetical protein